MKQQHSHFLEAAAFGWSLLSDQETMPRLAQGNFVFLKMHSAEMTLADLQVPGVFSKEVVSCRTSMSLHHQNLSNNS